MHFAERSSHDVCAVTEPRVVSRPQWQRLPILGRRILDCASSRSAPKQRGIDALLRVNLTLEQCATGVVRDLTVDTAIVCPRCAGTGTKSKAAPVRCTACGGSGADPVFSGQSPNGAVRTNGRPTQEYPCISCDGSGRVVPRACPHCGGAARVGARRSVAVRIPPGVYQGVRVRLQGAGEVGPGGGEPGDLYAEVDEETHRHFTRSGADLQCTVRISGTTAIHGGEVVVTGIFGDRITVGIPAGTAAGAMLTLNGHGMPHLASDGRGNLEIRVETDTPEPHPDIRRMISGRMRRRVAADADPLLAC